MSLLSDGFLSVGYILAFSAGLLTCISGVLFWFSRLSATNAVGKNQSHQLEEALQRGVAESLPGIEFQYHVEPGGKGHYRFVGEEAEEMLGISSQSDGFEERFLERVPAAYRGRHNTCVRAARDGEKPEQVEIPFDRSDGERVWLLLTSMLERRTVPGEGEKLVFSGIMLDVTERKRAEQKRQQVIYRVTDAIVEVDSEWRFTLLNDKAEELYDVEASELLGETYWEVFPNVRGTRFEEVYRKVMDTREPASFVEYYSGLDGWYDVQVYPNEEGGLSVYFQDVTEQKEREAALRRQRELLAQTQRLAGAWEVDLKTEEVTWSEEVYRIHEVDPDTEISLEEGVSFYAPESRPRAREAFRRCVEEGEPIDLELAILTAEGNRRWVHSVGAAVEQNGDVVKVVGAVQDITERKRRERELERQNDLFEKAQQIADVGAWEYDVQSEEAIWTTKVYQILGLPPGADNDLEGAYQLYHQEDRPEVRAALRGAIENEAPFDLEARLTTLDGEDRWVRVRGEPQVEEGEVVRVRGTIQNVTERKRRLKELERYERLIENLPVGVFRTTEAGEVVALNTALTEIFDSSESRLRQTKVESLYADAEERQGLLRTLRQEGEAEGRLLRAQTLEGEERWVRSTITFTEEEGERYLEGILEDVTERRERERQLEAVFNQTFQFSALLEPDGTIFRVNDRAMQLHGGSRSEIIGERAWRLPMVEAGEDTGRVREAVETARKGDVARYEREIPASGGGRQVLDVSFRPVTDEGGRVKLIVAEARDITEQKEREERLREERDLLDRLLATSPAAIVMLDEHGGFIRANERAKEVLGIGKNEVTKRAFDDPEWGIEAPDGSSIPEEELPFARVIRTEAPVRDYVHAVRWPDGTRRVLSVSGAPLYSAEGKIQGALFHLNDVTERRRRERVLRERQEKIEVLYEGTKKLLRTGSRNEIVSEVHSVLQDVFAYPFRHTAFVTEGKLIPKKTTAEGTADLPQPTVQPVDGDTVAARALKAGEAVVIADTDALDNDIDYGDLRSAAGVPIGQRGAIVVGKAEKGDFDRLNLHLLEVLGGYAALILERLRREKVLREAKEGAEAARIEAEEARDEAREAARLKSAFLANMSHEIRTPLTSIIGFAEVLGTEISDLDVSGSDSLEQQSQLIEQGGKRLLDTLEGVLHLSKLETGQMELDKQPVDVAGQAQRTAEELRPRAEKKDIELQVQEQDCPVQAAADQGGVQIVLQNLISNALRYTEEGGNVQVRTSKNAGRVVLEVEDTGIGMEPDVVDQLFEPFRQESEGMGREYEGSGVGLAVTQKAVEEMGGSIEVETEKGVGSCFTVQLPSEEDIFS